MKRITLLALVLIAHLSLCAQTFTVDGKLPLPPEREGSRHLRTIKAEDVVSRLNRDFTRSDASIKVVATSLNQEGLCLVRHDAFFNSFVTAFAEHRPLILSPDMICLIIDQGFAYYVNENPELMRDRVMEKGGKFNINVTPGRELKTASDWATAMGELTGQINKACKTKVANNLTANFSTSKINERIATQIVMMDIKSIPYEYESAKMACGIPSITLEGTPEDWQKVQEKVEYLEQFGLRWWTGDLKNIIKQFVLAAKGKPNQWFWQSMVMKRKPESLIGNICSEDPASMLDGWFLKFFPFCQNGRTPASVVHYTKDMLPELMRVKFNYRQTANSQPVALELWAGFIGAEEDEATYAIRPKIGWIVVESESEAEERFKIKRMNDEERVLIVNEVPDVLRRCGHLGKIKLKFKESVQLPDWINELDIDTMIFEGSYSDATVAQIISTMPQYAIKANSSSITLTRMRR